MNETFIADLRYSVVKNTKILPLALSSSSGSLRGGIVGTDIPSYGHHWRGNGLGEIKNRSRFRHDDPTGYFSSTEFSHRSGRGLYLGPLFNHFGHFLTESLSRIWAAKLLVNYYDYCIFVPQVQSASQRRDFKYSSLPQWQQEALAFFELRDVQFATQPAIYEEMIIPEQATYLFSDKHSSLHKQMLKRAVLERFGGVQAKEKYFFSRPKDLPSLEGEDLLAKYFKKRGYTIVSPEEFSFSEQVLMACQAKKVAGVQGSAFHIFNFLGYTNCDLLIFQRQGNQTTVGFEQTISPYISSVTIANIEDLGFDSTISLHCNSNAAILDELICNFESL